MGVTLHEKGYTENVIVFIDSSTTHIGLADIEAAMKHRIHLVSLVKNTTGDTQPLDKVMFGPWKRQLEIEKRDFIYKNGPSCRLNKLEKRHVVRCGTLAWRKVNTAQNRVAAFEKTGLWPVNRHIFDSKFASLHGSNVSDAYIADSCSSLALAVPSAFAVPASSIDSVVSAPFVDLTSTRSLAGIT